MKNTIIFLFFLIFLGCKKEQSLKAESLQNAVIKDTIRLTDNNQVIFISPTLSYIDKLKKSYKNQDDFYTMADDANFYVAEAGNYIIKQKIDTVNIENDKIIKIGSSTISLLKYKPWTLLLYEKGKQVKNIFPVDIEKEFPIYFSKKNESTQNIDDVLTSNHYTTLDIIEKNEIDINNDKKPDLALILQDKKENSKDFLLLKNIENKYAVLIKNKNAIPCEDCGNGAESFYDYKIDNASLSFSSSFKSNEDIYRMVFSFKNVNSNLLLDKVKIYKSKVGETSENESSLNKNSFGNISINDFNYSNFMSKFVLNK